MKACGIYAIRRISDGTCYVGSAKSIEMRWRGHRAMLNSDGHHAPHLQHSWSKHGAAAHEFVVLEACSVEILLEREQHYIDTLDSAFNVCRIAGSRRGVPQPREAVEKVAAANRGKKRIAETRARMSAWQKGRPSPHRGISRSAATRAKMSASKIGWRPTPEQRKHYGVHWIGRKHSAESRAKISATLTGRAKPLSERGRAIVVAMLRYRAGWRASDETRARLSAAQRGRKHSDETKEKMRLSALQRWAARRTEEMATVVFRNAST